MCPLFRRRRRLPSERINNRELSESQHQATAGNGNETEASEAHKSKRQFHFFCLPFSRCASPLLLCFFFFFYIFLFVAVAFSLFFLILLIPFCAATTAVAAAAAACAPEVPAPDIMGPARSHKWKPSEGHDKSARASMRELRAAAAAAEASRNRQGRKRDARRDGQEQEGYMMRRRTEIGWTLDALMQI